MPVDKSVIVPALEQEVIGRIRSAMRGQVLLQGDEGYEAARCVYNAMIDRRPALIIRCLGVSDVMAAVNLAREQGWPPAVRSGGHSVAGFGVCEGGLMIDLSQMKGIRVDPAKRIARAEPGVTWGELDRETGVFGLATPGGIISTTGIAGLTLGGGVGWLVRKHGLACDNLLSADIVTADGRLLRASERENADLFWGLRGGGGNFGIVTSFEYRLHPVGTVLGGMLLHVRERAREVLGVYRAFTESAPDELTVSAGLITWTDGVPMIALVACYAGDIKAGEALLGPLREFGPPLVDGLQPMPHTRIQRLLDDAFPPGRRNYWKSCYLESLSDEAIEVVVEYANCVPSPFSAVLVECYTGAASRLGESETAYPHRRERYNLHIFSAWAGPDDDDRNIEWTRRFWEAMKPFSSGRVYVNFLGDEGERGVRTAFGSNYERLAAIKKKYDPSNLFSHNHNVRPA